MKYIKVLEIETLFDLFKLIVEGENISITYVNVKDGTWVDNKCERYMTFLHYIDNFIIQYNGIFDSETKKFKKLEIYTIVQVDGGVNNEN